MWDIGNILAFSLGIISCTLIVIAFTLIKIYVVISKGG